VVPGQEVVHTQIRRRVSRRCAHFKGKIHALLNPGRRVVSVDEFFLGPLTTALTPDEILVDVEMPLFNSNTIGRSRNSRFATGLCDRRRGSGDRAERSGRLHSVRFVRS